MKKILFISILAISCSKGYNVCKIIDENGNAFYIKNGIDSKQINDAYNTYLKTDTFKYAQIVYTGKFTEVCY